MATVTINQDNYPEGHELEVPYLGLFPNGQTSEVDDDAWDRFVAHTGFEGDELVIDNSVVREEAEARAEAQELLHEPEDEVTKDALLKQAKALGIKGYSTMNKDELRTAIDQSTAAQSAPVDEEEDR